MVGISTCCLMDKPLEEALDELAALTDLIEVMDEGPHFITDPSLFESYTRDFTIHAPFHGMNIASVFEPVRKASVAVMVDCFCMAAAIGAPVVMHPGYFAWEQERAASDRQFRASLQELGCAAAERSVEFWFENMGDMNYFNLRTPADLALIGNTGLTLDTGHAHLNHCLPAFLDTPFRHMHIHDNKGKTDTHGPVGSGTIDFRPVMAALRRSHATAVIEVKTFVAATTSLQVLDAL
ncbi:MAG: sugar phosphate isomerase/epimerase [Methanoregulaceae archaeon]|nr:MAG: sugar phosphate isomerase/epimerase [Methanoregulaceae archaeon]